MNTTVNKLRDKMRFSDFPLGVYLLLAAVIVAFFVATQGAISPRIC